MKWTLIIFTLFIAFKNCTPVNSDLMQYHNIPEHYTGKVTIEFNMKEANSAVNDQGEFVFNIDDEGRLAVKEKQELGFINSKNTKFYSIATDGTAKEIPFYNQAKSSEEKVMRGPYPLNAMLIYFIDKKSEIDKYPNPSMTPSPRK